MSTLHNRIPFVVASFALMTFVGQLSRIGPALRLRTAGIPLETIRAHLALLDGSTESAAVASDLRAASGG